MGKLILEKQDLTYLSWAKVRNSSGTAGSFLKSYSELADNKIYYKLSDYDVINGVIGHECINELIVDRLLDILGIEHLSYDLIFADILLNGKINEVYLCSSADFKKKGETKTALDVFYELESQEDESPLEFCIRQGWEEEIYEMIVVDFLILNRDRHGANIEILRNRNNKTFRLTPLFDHGLSLMCRCRTDEDFATYDVMEDKLVQSYIGSRSAKDNLSLIPADKMPVLHPLKQSHRNILLDGLDKVLPATHLDKIWTMIWERWCYYENFRNSR